MKDYRLSEISEICEKMQEEYGSNACDMCENLHYGAEQFCIHKIGDDCPCEWNIDPRDMIELPCKCKSTVNRDWLVYYRSKYDCGLIEQQAFSSEAEADAFLVKKKKNGNDAQ